MFTIDQGERKLIRRTLIDEEGNPIPWDRIVDLRFSLMLGGREYHTFSKKDGTIKSVNGDVEFEITQEQSLKFPPYTYQLRAAVDVYDFRFSDMMTDKQWETNFMAIQTTSHTVGVYEPSIDEGEMKFSVIPGEIPDGPDQNVLDGEPVIGSISTTSESVTVPYTLVPNATLYEYQIEGSSDVNSIGIQNPLVLSKTDNITERIRIRAGRDEYRTEWSPYKEYTTNPDITPVLGTIDTDLTTATIPFTEEGLDIEYEIGGSYVVWGATSPIVISSLNEQSTYNGTVRFRNAGGGGPTTDISFETIEPAPTTIPTISTDELYDDGGSFNRTSVSGATSYEIEVGGVVTNIGTSNPYTIDGQDQNDTFEHRIRATNSGGETDWSDFFEVLTLPNVAPAFSLDEKTDTTASFTYQTVGGTGSLTYQYKVGAAGTWETVTGGSFTIEGFNPETSYDVYMRVTNSSGAGPESDPETITTSSELDAPVLTTENIETTPTTMYVEWGAVTGANGYRYRLNGGDEIDLGEVTNETITDLQPGSYLFEIRSLDTSGAEEIRSVWTSQMIVLPDIEEDESTIEQFSETV